jgi:hypothetical protein
MTFDKLPIFDGADRLRVIGFDDAVVKQQETGLRLIQILKTSRRCKKCQELLPRNTASLKLIS